MKRTLLIGLLIFVLGGCGVEWFPDPSATVAILTTTLPGATVNTVYSQTLSAFGGTAPYSWSVSSGTLPVGLTLSTAGVISGTPTTAGTSNFTVQVSDSSSPATTATRALTLVVAAASTTTTPTTLSAGQTITLGAGSIVKVPIGTTINLNGTITTVTGTNSNLTTSAGAVVTVPASATGTPDITITVQ